MKSTHPIISTSKYNYIIILCAEEQLWLRRRRRICSGLRCRGSIWGIWRKKSRDTVHSRNTNVHPCHLVLNLNYFLDITVLYTKIPSERCILHYFCTCKSWTCFDVKKHQSLQNTQYTAWSKKSFAECQIYVYIFIFCQLYFECK